MNYSQRNVFLLCLFMVQRGLLKCLICILRLQITYCVHYNSWTHETVSEEHTILCIITFISNFVPLLIYLIKLTNKIRKLYSTSLTRCLRKHGPQNVKLTATPFPPSICLSSKRIILYKAPTQTTSK